MATEEKLGITMIMRKQALILSGAAIALIVGYIVIQNRYAPPDIPVKPLEQTANVAKSDTSPKVGTAISAEISDSKVFTVEVDPGKGSSLKVYRLRMGEHATFAVNSSIDGKLEVHGYTANLQVKAHNELNFDLIGLHTGRFPLHIHGKDGSHLEAGILEVMPK